MALSGYVKLHRSLLGWAWHDDPATGWLFINLVLMANHVPSEWRGISIQRGQLVTGRKALAEQTGLSEQSVRTALNHLKSTGEITISPTNKFSLVTIVNYGKFQDTNSDSTSTPTSKLTSDQPAANQQPTTNKKYKKYENEEKGVAEPPPAVLAFDGTDLSGILQQHQHADELARRYGLPVIDATRDALLEDFERYGAEAVEAALKEAALKDKRGGLSIAFYRSILNRVKGEEYGTPQKSVESSWNVGNVV